MLCDEFLPHTEIAMKQVVSVFFTNTHHIIIPVLLSNIGYTHSKEVYAYEKYLNCTYQVPNLDKRMILIDDAHYI